MDVVSEWVNGAAGMMDHDFAKLMVLCGGMKKIAMERGAVILNARFGDPGVMLHGQFTLTR